MRQETIDIFKFSELSDDAKENAIEENRNWNVEGFEWWDSVYDDVRHVCSLIGFDVDDIYFSGFWSQGDGASIFGSYRHAKGALKAVKEYAPQDTELQEIVAALQTAQKRNFYQLYATVSRSYGGGNYNHSGTMSVSVDHENRDYVADNDESDVTDALRQLADWTYSRLEEEYEYLTSDEIVKESLIANDCEFTIDGETY